MAYNLADRFPPPPKYITLLDPGSYHPTYPRKRKQDAAPFLVKSPRNTQDGPKLWTEAIYDRRLPSNIPNCTSMLSKTPRFPYEAFSSEDLEELLCKCGISSPCECPTGEEIEEEVLCHGKLRRRLFKGPTPRSCLGDEGLSTPSRNDKGFYIAPSGAQYRLTDIIKEECPPFYDDRVNESTAFYQGCKWSKRTAKDYKNKEVRPGPADYYIEREPTTYEICQEKVRAFKRKTSRQLRYIEMVQRKNILENHPGPATYRPMLPKGTDLQFLGSKAERFPNTKSKYDISPGPADHRLRRDFDANELPEVLCHAKLPEPACFGMKGKRFKTQREEGPSPASYQVKFTTCNFVNCRTAPFGCSSKRFKQEIIEKSDDDEIVETQNEPKPCILPTWQFKSKTIRMKPLVKKLEEQSPADVPLKRIDRSAQSKCRIPFSSTEGRFSPWYSWIPVHGMLETPGPGYYCLEKPKCGPPFKYGSLCRATRFPKAVYKAPPPNEYQVSNGIETILATHNKTLKDNIENQHKFIWEKPKPKISIPNYDEKRNALLWKCISILNTDDEPQYEKMPKYKSNMDKEIKSKKKIKNDPRPTMLRCFLYAYPQQPYY